MSEVKLDGPTIYQKLQKITKTWNYVSGINIWSRSDTFKIFGIDRKKCAKFRCTWRSRRGDGKSSRRPFAPKYSWFFVSKEHSKNCLKSTKFLWRHFSPNQLFTFSLWLLNFEFSETILLVTREKIIFAVSPKKSKYFIQKMLNIWLIYYNIEILLEAMIKPGDDQENFPTIEIIAKDSK